MGGSPARRGSAPPQSGSAIGYVGIAVAGVAASALVRAAKTRRDLFACRVELGGGPAHTVVVEAAPESHLRFLAGQVLVRDGPGDEFIVASASLAAVANAYVMLGLLTEPEAEAALNATANANRDLRRAPVHPRCCCHRGPVRVGSGHSAAPVRLALGAPERWPAAIPSFMVSAIDDLGAKHEGRPGSWSGYGEGEGHGDFTLWRQYRPG